MLPFVAGFDQLAYVTTDIDRACAVFGDYGIPHFHIKRGRVLNAIARGVKGQIVLNLAFANIGPVQIELIQPVSGLCDLYAEPLPRDGSFGLLFHHIRVRVSGTMDDWERNRGEVDLKKRTIALDGGSEGARYIYVDDRAQLGHYVEYVWFSTETAAQRGEDVPHYSGTR